MAGARSPHPASTPRRKTGLPRSTLRSTASWERVGDCAARCVDVAACVGFIAGRALCCRPRATTNLFTKPDPARAVDPRLVCCCLYSYGSVYSATNTATSHSGPCACKVLPWGPSEVSADLKKVWHGRRLRDGTPAALHAHPRRYRSNLLTHSNAPTTSNTNITVSSTATASTNTPQETVPEVNPRA